MMYPGTTVTQGQSLLAIMLFALRHHLTGAALGDLLDLMNLLIHNLVPASRYLFKKFFGDPALSSVSHFYCDACQNYIGKNPSDEPCSHCGTSFNTTTNAKTGNFLISVSLKDLLKDTLENHGIDLIPKSVKHARHNIRYLTDEKMYQKLLKQGVVCSSDAIARPLLRNCKQFNGEYGCDWCLYPGDIISKRQRISKVLCV